MQKTNLWVLKMEPEVGRPGPGRSSIGRDPRRRTECPEGTCPDPPCGTWPARPESTGPAPVWPLSSRPFSNKNSKQTKNINAKIQENSTKQNEKERKYFIVGILWGAFCLLRSCGLRLVLRIPKNYKFLDFRERWIRSWITCLIKSKIFLWFLHLVQRIALAHYQ